MEAMGQEDRGLAIAELLAGFWERSKQPGFVEYLATTYGLRTKARPLWAYLHIMEAEEADFDWLRFPSSLIRRLWVVSDQGMRQITEIPDRMESNKTFFDVPSIRFCARNDRVLVSEFLGPGLLCYRLYRLTSEAGKAKFGEILEERTFPRRRRFWAF